MEGILPRSRRLRRLERQLARSPVVAILGARQVGKTTLAGQLSARWQRDTHRFDLESARDLARLDEPTLALERLEGLVILDEIHRRPDLFTVLRVLVDRPEAPASFLILGSASPDLLRQSSESLAGRIAFHDLTGFDCEEVGALGLTKLWLRGGFPRSFLASSDEESLAWREDFMRTFLERDLPDFGIRIASSTLQRFWSMLAHWHGQTWNGAEFARAFGVTNKTVDRYLDVLVATLLIRRLSPWHENLRKRQVKAPKIYVHDSGLLHGLLGLETLADLERHPKVGASWESFAMQEVITRLDARERECFFWATHSGAELDLLVVRGNRRLGFEFKRTDAPRTTKSMRVAMESLGLETLDVVHAGGRTFPLADRIRALALSRVLKDLRPISSA